jgi:AraC-like DNA-binding protein
MEIQISGLILLNLTSCILGLVVAAILWRYPRENNYYNRLLSLSFLILTFGQTIGFLVESRLILQVPHLYRIGNLFGLLFMPLSWLYLRGLLKNQKLTWRDAIHVLPALLYFIDYAPFFFSGAEVKLAAIEDRFQNLDNHLRYQESWLFPPWFHLWLRNLLILFYWVLQVRMLVKIFRFKSKDFITENRTWIRWLTIYVSLQFFLFSPFFVAFFYHQVQYWQAIMVGISIVMIFTAISMIIQPVILYGIKGWIIHPGTEDHPSHHGTSHLIYISKERHKKISGLLEDLMLTKKPYLKAGYSLLDLTNDIGIPLYQVSFFLNHEKGMNFHDMLNEYRIEYSRELMGKENNHHLTLEAIAFESGFGNRNSFTTAFKKFTGETPSVFLRGIKQTGANGNGNGNGNGMENGNGHMISKGKGKN